MSRRTPAKRVQIGDANLLDIIPCVTLETLLNAAAEDGTRSTGDQRGDHITGYTVVVTATVPVEVEMPYDTYLKAQTIRRLRGY